MIEGPPGQEGDAQADRRRAVLIAGPTASGKSAVAMRLAREFDGVVINADSMQVYEDLRVLSARPDAQDEREVPHRLYGFVDGAEAFSTGRWLDAVGAELEKTWANGRLAIVVGGTGLYFRALESGLAAVPEIPADVRADLRKRGEAEGIDVLYRELEQRDREMAARLEAGDRQRILRALEVLEATGQSLLEWQRTPVGDSLLGNASVGRILLEVDRDALYARCDRRFDEMMTQGALDEVRALAARGLDRNLPVMKALGVPQIVDYLASDISLEDAAVAAKTGTRRYAKRQLTWFRSNMIAWNAVSTNDMERLVAEIFAILRDKRLTR